MKQSSGDPSLPLEAISYMLYYDSMVAMCQLLLYCVTNGNSQLCNIMVEGEEVRSHDLGAGILTRSKKSKGMIVTAESVNYVVNNCMIIIVYIVQ